MTSASRPRPLPLIFPILLILDAHSLPHLSCFFGPLHRMLLPDHIPSNPIIPNRVWRYPFYWPGSLHKVVVHHIMFRNTGLVVGKDDVILFTWKTYCFMFKLFSSIKELNTKVGLHTYLPTTTDHPPPPQTFKALPKGL